MPNDDEHWKTKSFVEPNGKCHSKYYYKRKEAKRIVLNSRRAHSLAGYRLIEKDLDSCLIWLNIILNLLSDDDNFNRIGEASLAIKDRNTMDMVKGLFVASLAFYGKCFAETNKRGIRLDKKSIDRSLLDIHEKLICQRNNYCAHSGDKGYENAQTIVAIPNKATVIPYLAVEIKQLDTIKKNGIEDIINLINFIKNKIIKEKREKITAKIMENEVRPLLKPFRIK